MAWPCENQSSVVRVLILVGAMAGQACDREPVAFKIHAQGQGARPGSREVVSPMPGTDDTDARAVQHDPNGAGGDSIAVVQHGRLGNDGDHAGRLPQAANPGGPGDPSNASNPRKRRQSRKRRQPRKLRKPRHAKLAAGACAKRGHGFDLGSTLQQRLEG